MAGASRDGVGHGRADWSLLAPPLCSVLYRLPLVSSHSSPFSRQTMHEQRSAALRPSSLAMPRLSIPRRRSSMLSSASDPHTPPPRNSPLPVFSSAATNRKSSDSWNSSNCDGADDLEWEWKPEQTRLLSRVSLETCLDATMSPRLHVRVCYVQQPDMLPTDFGRSSLASVDSVQRPRSSV